MANEGKGKHPERSDIPIVPKVWRPDACAATTGPAFGDRECKKRDRQDEVSRIWREAQLQGR